MHSGKRRCRVHWQRAVSLGDSWTRLRRKHFHTKKNAIKRRLHTNITMSPQYRINRTSSIYALTLGMVYDVVGCPCFLFLGKPQAGWKNIFFFVKRYHRWEHNVFETNTMARRITITVHFLVEIISPNYGRSTNRSGIIIGIIHYR